MNRIQLSRKKGYKKPSEAINVARPTKWGNPFGWEFCGKEAAKRMYREWLAGERVPVGHDVAARRLWILEHIHELRGKDLACWCAPGEPCHADVLMQLANQDQNE